MLIEWTQNPLHPELKEDMTDLIAYQTLVLPTGMNINDPNDAYEAPTFGVSVAWKAPERYSVERFGGGKQANRQGEWRDRPEWKDREDFRFTYEEALEMARSLVNGIVINGHTWAQWKQQETADREQG